MQKEVTKSGRYNFVITLDSLHHWKSLLQTCVTIYVFKYIYCFKCSVLRSVLFIFGLFCKDCCIPYFWRRFIFYILYACLTSMKTMITGRLPWHSIKLIQSVNGQKSAFSPLQEKLCVGSKNGSHVLELSSRSLSACKVWRRSNYTRRL